MRGNLFVEVTHVLKGKDRESERDGHEMPEEFGTRAFIVPRFSIETGCLLCSRAKVDMRHCRVFKNG